MPALEPSALRAMLPGFLADFIDEPTHAAQARKVVADLIASWPDDALASVTSTLADLGNDYRTYLANPWMRTLSRQWCSALLEPHVDGIEHLRAATEAGPTLILCNHVAYVDTVATDFALAATGSPDLADRLLTAAGPKVYTDLFRRIAAAGQNTLPVPQSPSLGHTEQINVRELARRTRQSLDAANSCLADGMILQLYPEGSRSRSGRLGPFLRGIKRWVALPGLRIVPLALTGTRAIQPLEAHMLKPGPVHLSFGAPFLVDAAQGADETLVRAHGAIASLLPEALQPDPQDAVLW